MKKKKIKRDAQLIILEKELKILKQKDENIQENIKRRLREERKNKRREMSK